MTTLYMHLTDGEAKALARFLRLVEGADEMILFKRRRVAHVLNTAEEQQLRRIVQVAREQLRQAGHGR
jgi:hypothetical protein